MELAHWVIRTLYALILANLFIGGLYAFLRGYMTRKIYQKYWYTAMGSIKKYTIPIKNKFATYLEWDYMGQTYTTGSTQFYLLGKKQSHPIKIFVRHHQAKINTWAYNGIGAMTLGVILLATSTLGITYLI